MRSISRSMACIWAMLLITGFSHAQTQKDVDAALKKKAYPQAVQLYYDMAALAVKGGERGKAIESYEKGIEVAREHQLTTMAQEGWYQLGIIHFNDKNYREATKSFDESASYAPDNSLAKARVDLYLGKSWFLRGREKRALTSFEEALASALTSGNTELQKTCYLWLEKVHTALGNDAKATEYKSSYALLGNEEERLAELDAMEQKVSSVTEELKTQEQELVKVADSLKEVREISEKQQLQIDLLDAENELASVSLKAKEAELRNNVLVRNSFIIGFFLVAVMGLMIYQGYKNKLKANEQIRKKQADIESSINYGLRIQRAMLPTMDKFKELLPTSFVLFKPRDVVSGDFYWINELYSEKVAVAAVDCTGHGVPGAFMSMIGSNALDSIVQGYVDEPDKILNELHKKIVTSLRQKNSGNKDGMDMALCVIDADRDQLHFAGAKNNLMYIKDGELFQVRGDKHPIGGVRKIKSEYQSHTIDLVGQMHFYIYSDGFVDQFGGPQNMKFMRKQFKDLLLRIHQLPMEEQQEQMEQAFEEWKGEGRQTDDVLVIGFKLTA